MSTQQQEKLVFGRYRREECGLPPTENPFFARWKKPLMLLGIIAAVTLAGLVAGSLRSRWRGLKLEALANRIASAPTQAEKDLLLGEGRLLATALNNNPSARLHLAESCMVASIGAPRQMGYYGNAAMLLDGVGEALAGSPIQSFRAESMQAHVLAELDREPEAMEALGRANASRERMENDRLLQMLKLNLVNLQAYILATAKEPQVRNPEKALHLAQFLITSRDELPNGEYASGVAAYVDTLATAWFAAGNSEKALKTQALALGLAKPGDLSVYLKHYDEFANAKKMQPPGLVALLK